jgi:hypothetical protein
VHPASAVGWVAYPDHIRERNHGLFKALRNLVRDEKALRGEPGLAGIDNRVCVHSLVPKLGIVDSINLIDVIIEVHARMTILLIPRKVWQAKTFPDSGYCQDRAARLIVLIVAETMKLTSLRTARTR